ncbi:putative uncharacterized protein [Clostridium sp. CAG:1024]|jgi:glycosyl-4,4'-diaponeurosporenoate acyltransferase|nr:hypothetical protein [Clostridium sp.]MDO4342845.1 hypothetical protein [Eubacteriales bacterium]CCX42231.1 putative uncharacterized protein [Clostridium sp. CAG:1024]
MTVITETLRFVIPVAVIGILAHVIGEALPRRWFDASRFPYRAYAFERNGRFYEALGIRKWKNVLPDKSRIAPGTYRKAIRGSAQQHSAAHMERLLQETCVAECVHWALLVISPILLFTMESPAAYVMTPLYGLSNLPYIMIQRYNRPRLAVLSARMQRKAQEAAA